MSDNEIKNDVVVSEENKAQESEQKTQATVEAATDNMDPQSETYLTALHKFEEEKKAAKKKKKRKRFLIFAVIIVAIIVFNAVANGISNSIDFNASVDALSAEIQKEEYDLTSYLSAVDSVSSAQVSDGRIAKAFFNLGKEAVEQKNLDCFSSLFDRSIQRKESYLKKVSSYMHDAVSSAESDGETVKYASYYISLGNTLDEELSKKVKTSVIEMIVSGKVDEFKSNVGDLAAYGLAEDKEINKKIHTVAMEAYNGKKYQEAYEWFSIYKGDENIKSAKQESTYEYVIGVLFSNSFLTGIDDKNDWAVKMLSTDEMKNYKQSEGVRLYCEVADVALTAYRSQSELADFEEDMVKSKLMYPDSFNYIGKNVTSDFYMRKKGDDGFEICYDHTIVYSALNRYGYAVRDTYEMTTGYEGSLNGSDYLLALKVFINFSNENMLKYARTGKFTNTKITLS